MHLTRRILPCDINPGLRKCLLQMGSMTQYLSTQYQSPLQINQRAEHRIAASLALQHHFNLPAHSPLWQRDVILSIRKSPVMFARSYMPYAKARQLIQKLGDQPLGNWLFQCPQMHRSQFTYFQIMPNELQHYELLHTIKFNFNSKDTIWARQSDFILPDTKLQLTEFFLPEIVGRAKRALV